MAYPAAVQAVLDKAGVSTLEEWNAAMSQGTAGGVNAVQRAAGHTNVGELVWSTVGLEADNALADKLNRELAEAASVEAELARRRDATWAAHQAALLPDMTVPSVWNPTPTNYNPDPLGRSDLERQRAEIAAADALWDGSGPQHTTNPVVIQVLEDRRSGIPIRAIDDLGGSATIQEDQVSLLSSVVGGAAKFLSGGAKALLESRRETGTAMTYAGDPKTVPGMPSYSPAVPDWFPGGTPWNPVTALGNYASNTYAAGQQAASAILGQGQKGVIMGAVEPKRVSRNELVCPPKYVLGVDNKCYPKAMLPRSARKWTPDPKPVVSRSDQKAITRAASAKKRLVKLTNAAGAHATITRPHRHATNGKKK